MASTLPDFMALATKPSHRDENNTAPDVPTYLGCMDNGDLGYKIKELMDPRAKFQPIDAGNGFYHILSCYNNKYWARSDERGDGISAIGEKQENDRNKINCTLFKPHVEKDIRVYFTLPDGSRVDHYININDKDKIPYLAKRDQHTEPGKPCLFDLTSVVLTLPKYVAFKAHNLCYLRLKDNSRFVLRDDAMDADGMHIPYDYNEIIEKFLEFSTKDTSDKTTIFEAIPTSDGYFKFKSAVTGKYWIISPTEAYNIWVYCEGGDKATGPTTEFMVFKKGKEHDNICTLKENNVYYLKCRARTERICKKLVRGDKGPCLTAGSTSFVEECFMVIEERSAPS